MGPYLYFSGIRFIFLSSFFGRLSLCRFLVSTFFLSFLVGFQPRRAIRITIQVPKAIGAVLHHLPHLPLCDDLFDLVQGLLAGLLA
jgi:hypothetical protein